MEHRRAFSGSLLSIVSGVSFGALAIFARMAYADGVAPTSLLLLRFTIAAAIMVIVAVVRRDTLPRGRTLVGLVAMGAVGYVGQSFCYFTALTMTNAGLVAILLYLYPALVAALAWIFLKERLGSKRIAAVVLALAGSALTMVPKLLPGARSGGAAGNPLGIAFGVGAALIYSLYIMVGARVLRSAGPIVSSATIMSAAAIVYGAITAANGLTLPRSTVGWVGVLGVAIIATVVAITTFLAGVRMIGPTRASVISTVEPVTTVILAAIVLQEPISLLTGIGGAAILVAAIMLAREPAAEPALQPQ